MSLYIKEGLGVSSDIMEKLFGFLHPGPKEFMRSLPDSLFLGTSLLALLTQNFPLGILVFAMTEFAVLDWLLTSVLSSVKKSGGPVSSDMCLPGLPSPYQISILGHLYPQTEFPSASILFIASTIFYTMASILNFRDELKELGQTEAEWKVRIPLSMVFSTILLLCYVFWRVAYGCDGVVSALGSVAIGAVFGGIVYLLHVYLFGRNSINFLGLPLLADKAEGGSPLYVCAKPVNK